MLKVYVLARGECLYQGAVNQLVPYLESVKLPCPMYHNPADYGNNNKLRQFPVSHKNIKNILSTIFFLYKLTYFFSNWTGLWRIWGGQNRTTGWWKSKWKKFAVVR